MITSLHNPKLQRIRSLLSDRKERNEQRVFVLEGIRLVEEAVQVGWPLEHLLFCETISARGRLLLEKCELMGVQADEVPEKLMSAISDTEASQGLVAVAGMKELPVKAPPDFVLIADAVRDPGNLGTLLRTAVAAGVDALALTPGTADAFNPKVVRSAMGAHFNLPLLTASWEEIEARFKPALSFFLAEMESSKPIWEADFRAPCGIIIGGEAEGASQPARRLADHLVNIPMPGNAESLNAAIAAGIILFEVVRQRKS